MSLQARRIVDLPSLNAVAVSSVASSSHPVGVRKYHTTFFRYKDGTANQATLEAAITNVKVLMNGKEQWNISLARLNSLLALEGYAFQTGLIVIPWSFFKARTPAGEEAFGLGTADLATLSVELTISGAAVAPALTGWAEIEDRQEASGIIRKIRTFPSKVCSGAGTFQIQDLPRRPQEAYRRIHLVAAQASAVKVMVDGVEWFNMPRIVARALYAKQNLTLQTGWYSVIFDATQQPSDLLPMARNVGGAVVPVQEFRLDITMDAAETFDVVTETVGIAD